jgi:DNA-binding HxlR family transcriptional regulator
MDDKLKNELPINKIESCQLINATKLLSKKWIGFIFCQLFENEKMFFNDLKAGINDKSTEQLSSSSLSQTLKTLEENAIIERITDQFNHPPRVLYTLTEKGKELRIILALLKKWSTKWTPIANNQEKCCVIQFLPDLELKIHSFE